MLQKLRFAFLTTEFYNDFPYSDYPEIEQKPLRPYIQILATINNRHFAIPLRSNINHPHVFWTDKPNKCGIDFSKAVIITDEKYIDTTRRPHIRQSEFNALRGKDYRIKQKMEQYIREFQEAKNKLYDPVCKQLVEKSTLQYFEEYL